MITYECLFCGVTFHRHEEMHQCSICGHETESGWFREKMRQLATQHQPAHKRHQRRAA